MFVQKFPAASVIGQTNTDTSHERLLSLGVFPRLKEKAGDEQCPFVVFSAPPSGSEDYAAEVEAALKYWDGSGAFVFTSSTAVYAASTESLSMRARLSLRLGSHLARIGC